ncbi:LytR/AlgR family response regulator transcription factor [Polaribacter gangjinensis]|uniref:HTH LytTR-type domain-containing protein n=1 Tax=Polaribacter gangjinensis TaxID=574710 RepID=A0A2S7WBW0_9FLAO|nr:response regulator transcription factor [Polaribacter gangjinensis]PQJ74896.1 hypothetical protein BTO13_06390 [Polaribacter gangjinensis]
MKVLQAIVIENDIEVIKLLQQFEIENSVLFSILDIVEDCKNITKLINEKKPDVLFISRDEHVFDPKILNDLTVRKPKLLFASKDKCQAFEAFGFNAIDFLLKPLTTNSLIISIYKTIKYLEMETVFQDDVLGKIKTINALPQNFEYVSISSVDKIELLKMDDIIFCKADGKYTEFNTINASVIISSKNLGEYALSFNNNFFRIHHSYVVNIKYLVKIIKNNGLFCELKNGHILPVAKRRQEEFMKFINHQ